MLNVKNNIKIFKYFPKPIMDTTNNNVWLIILPKFNIIYLNDQNSIRLSFFINGILDKLNSLISIIKFKAPTNEL